MSNSDGTIRDHTWEVEKAAKQYAAAIRIPQHSTTIESFLKQYSHLPHEVLLLQLIQVELNELGNEAASLQYYQTRFPEFEDQIQELFSGQELTRKDPLELDEVVGCYRIEKMLGRGAVGFVYLAHDERRSQAVAIKILRPDWKSVCGSGYRDLFQDEARLIKKLHHRSIVQLLDSGSHQGLPYHVFRYVEGCTLREYCKNRVLGPVEASRLIADVADAVHYSHRNGVVHRDLTPANILVDRRGKAFVTDFGIALDRSEIGAGSGYVGTPMYMSPEQAHGNSHHLDGRADVFALGVILYEITTGTHPFGTPEMPREKLLQLVETIPAPPLRQRVDVPELFEQVCLRALARDPVDRFRTSGDFGKALRTFCWKHQWRYPVVGLAMVSVLLLTVGIYRWLEGNRSKQTLESHSGLSMPKLQAKSRPLDENDLNDDTQVLDKAISSLMPEGVHAASTESIKSVASLIIARIQSTGEIDETAASYFGGGIDNTLQTTLVHQCFAAKVPALSLFRRIEKETQNEVKYGLLLALGEFPLEQIPKENRDEVIHKVFEWFCTHPHPGVHSACEWTLRQWQAGDAVRNARRQLQFAEPDDTRQWYEVLPDIQMIAFRNSHSKIATDSKKDAATPLAKMPNYDFAISAHEITEIQNTWITKSASKLSGQDAVLSPQANVTWHDAARICNKLTEMVGLPNHQWCYEAFKHSNGKTYYRMHPDALTRRGFRMPTVAEWQYIARANSTTRRYWGRVDQYITRYANNDPGRKQSTIDIGSLKPNSFGFFDTLGNLSEWIHSGPTNEEKDENKLRSALRMVRGGSASTLSGVSADADYALPADEISPRLGLRIAQSLPARALPTDGPTFLFRTSSSIPVPASITTSHVDAQPVTCVVDRVLPLDAELDLGGVFRGQPSQHEFFLRNDSSKSWRLQSIQAEDGMKLDDKWIPPANLDPQQVVHLPLKLDQSIAGPRRGKLIFEWSENEVLNERRIESRYYVRGPALTVFGMTLDRLGHATIDLGRIQPGAGIYQSIAITNRGDQPVKLVDPGVTGALKMIRKVAKRELLPDEFAGFDLQLDTMREGDVVGTLEMESNDSLVPKMTIDFLARIEVPPSIPVIGVFRKGKWYIDRNHDGNPDKVLEFGKEQDLPLLGDFNGDQKIDLALLRKETELPLAIHIRLGGSSFDSEPEIIQLDASNGRVLVADFNTDGKSDVILIDHVDHDLRWRVDTDGDGKWNQTLFYGHALTEPVCGWTRQGEIDIGFVEKHEREGLANSWNWKGRIHEQKLLYGLPGDLPLIADFNGDGESDEAVFRIIQGQGTFLINLNQSAEQEWMCKLGNTGDIPIAFNVDPYDPLIAK